MALVEITAGNVFAGANLRKLEVGAVVEVDDATAARWKASGKAKDTDKKKGEKLVFEVATPSAPSGDLSDLQKQLADALDNLAEVTKSRDEARNRAVQLAEQSAEDKIASDEKLAEMTKRAKDAEAALEELKKKVK
ncbi:hypothetical protein BFW94_12450 [Enterobacter ludwigii]|uniref:hypothetical protein n=1 Tax=Enterobacter ludwigii TaxID=299767 RepID=UPI0009996A7E|nr:hypothetical protein [Enterobacter ludwigii]OPB23624.1 hypothetical protein BFW94_12450 [Enterobacter ludwigii]